ncbi:MAG: ROK family protein [Streptosporangiaceae bacterium]
MTEANLDSSAPRDMAPRQSVAQAAGQNVFGVVDVGGTKIVAGVASATEILRTERLSTHALRGPDDIVDRIARALTGLRLPGLPSMSAVGLSVPGPLDRRSGVVHFTPNLLWQHYPVADRLSQRLGGIPVLIDDDANCAALGEAWQGTGKGFAHLVCLTIGTGIGGAIIIDGALVHGHQDLAGEIGHMAIVPDGPPCACGHSGCLEAVASGAAIGRLGAALLTQNESPALARLAQTRGGQVDADLVFQAAASNDAACQAVLGKVAEHLGAAIASLVQVLNPQAVVLGGGVMSPENAAWLIPAIQAKMNRHLFEVQRGGVQVLRGELGDVAGLWGALQLVAPLTRAVLPTGMLG